MSVPERLSQETIYKGRVFDIRKDSVREGDVEYSREVVVHRGSCVVVPVFGDGTVAVVRQYRHAAGKYLIEIPAGTLEEGEDPMIGAVRELEEEIGVRASRVQKLAAFYVSPGFLTEKMHVFMATGLTEVGQKLEDDEILTVERHPFDTLLEMINKGEIEDAKTIIGIQAARNSLESGV